MLLCGCLVVPAAMLIRVSLHDPWTIDGFTRELVAETILLAVKVAIVTTAASFALALIAVSGGRWLRAALLGVILLPKLAGPLTISFALQRLFDRGPLATLLAEVYQLLPYGFLVMLVQLQSLDGRLMSAARGLGATRGQAFRKVTLPMCLPGLLLTFQLSLIWGLAAFLGPVFLGGPEQATLSVDLHRQAFEYGRWPRAAMEGVVLLTLILVAAIGIPAATGRFARWSR
jgi:ABC-type spermidine/putrescine transport system permease subunit I